MATEVLCPECGGVIGGRYDLDSGTYPCRCDQATVDEHLGEIATATATEIEARAAATPKVCVNCGKDLTGHTRFKDSIGYWCKDCHKADKAATDGVRCADCSRKFPEEKLIEFEGKKRCLSCEKERQKKVLEKLRREAKEVRYDKKEFETIKWLAIATGVLIFIAVVGRLLFHH
jgi:hypothetical protein